MLIGTYNYPLIPYVAHSTHGFVITSPKLVGNKERARRGVLRPFTVLGTLRKYLNAVMSRNRSNRTPRHWPPKALKTNRYITPHRTFVLSIQHLIGHPHYCLSSDHPMSQEYGARQNYRRALELLAAESLTKLSAAMDGSNRTTPYPAT